MEILILKRMIKIQFGYLPGKHVKSPNSIKCVDADKNLISLISSHSPIEFHLSSEILITHCYFKVFSSRAATSQPFLTAEGCTGR
jgi:hypothetical protein